VRDAGSLPAVTDPQKTRELGLWSLLALGINGIVGVGIFFAPNAIAEQAPGWTGIAVVAGTGLALVPVALAVSTMGRRFDEDGGPVLYARVAFGEAAGFIVGWLAYTAALFSMSAVFTGFMGAVIPPFLGKDTSPLVTVWIVRGAAIALLSILTLIAATGVKISARVWSGLTVLKLLPLIGLAVIASILPSSSGHEPLTSSGQTHWLTAALIATFVFQGFEIVPVVAGQAKASSKHIPIAVLGSLGISTLLYVVLMRGAVTGVHDLAHSGSPLVATAQSYGGNKLSWVVKTGLNVSSLGIAFGMVVTTPRFLSALSPRSRFGREDLRGVPMLALLTTWAIVTPLLCVGNLGELLTLSSLSVVMQYLLVALALAKFAFRRERGLSPLRAWSALPTVVVAVALMGGATMRSLAYAAVCAAMGAGMYLGSRAFAPR
jgi:basic amino acid/polyamine antiporter, APA family